MFAALTLLRDAPRYMKPFREIQAHEVHSANIREEMDQHGYVMIRNLLSSDDLNPLLKDITEVLRDAGWLQPNSNPIQRVANAAAACADGDPAYKITRDRVFSLQSFHALPHHVLLQEVMKLLVGEQLLIHPKSEARLIFPNFERGIIHAHQDYAAVAGDEETFTAWIALHDCPPVQGPLRILDGSHRFGLQPTAGKTGYIPPGTERGEDWKGGEINAGDVLFFHSLTVHEATPNRSNRVRVSQDCRFQSYARTVNPAALVFTGSGSRSWESTYAKWTTDELKYYWTRLPLCLKPSKHELAELARTAESAEMRTRYARILERLSG
jgi:ectoine hydroxylase-related dioxygenase (phytanoyl-CoA dioxygenase family)